MTFTFFTVIGPNDAAIFEYGRSSDGTATTNAQSDTLQLARQFMMYSAVDLVEEAMWAKGDVYLSKVDVFDDRFFVSAYVGFSPLKLLLMQGEEPHDNVRPFFVEAHELCVKYLLSPFASPSVPVRSREFEEKMIAIFAKRF